MGNVLLVKTNSLASENANAWHNPFLLSLSTWVWNNERVASAYVPRSATYVVFFLIISIFLNCPISHYESVRPLVKISDGLSNSGETVYGYG